jgi:hypothetical protein
VGTLLKNLECLITNGRIGHTISKQDPVATGHVARSSDRAHRLRRSFVSWREIFFKAASDFRPKLGRCYMVRVPVSMYV